MTRREELACWVIQELVLLRMVAHGHQVHGILLAATEELCTWEAQLRACGPTPEIVGLVQIKRQEVWEASRALEGINNDLSTTLPIVEATRALVARGEVEEAN